MSAVDDQELDENLWMSSTQFIQLLDKEEAKEVEKYHFEADNKRQGEEEEAKDLTISFLDQEARIPFHKLKQVRRRRRRFALLLKLRSAAKWERERKSENCLDCRRPTFQRGKKKLSFLFWSFFVDNFAS